MELTGVEEEEDEEEPKTLPWPLNFPEEEEEVTFFMNPLTLSFTSSIFVYDLKNSKFDGEEKKRSEMNLGLWLRLGRLN
jgi:hypothetical protein